MGETAWTSKRTHALPRRSARFQAALAALPVATAIGEATDPMLGLFIGFPFVFIAMLVGLSYWDERFAGHRWLTRTRRVEVSAGAQDYRGAQALDFRADGQRRTAKAIYVNTAKRPGADGRGVYAVLVDTEHGLVEVDEFAREDKARQLAEELRARLGVDVMHAAAGPAHGGDSTFDGLLTWTAMAAPVIGFLPMLLIAPNPAWVPAMACAVFVLASLALDVRVRTTASTTAEEQFRARLPNKSRVRIDVARERGADLEVRDERGDRERRRRARG